MTPYNERRLPAPRMHRGCLPYVLPGLVLVCAILVPTIAAGAWIAAMLAGVG